METLRNRRLIKAGTLSAGILLILALLAIVNYFSSKYYKRFDWTGSHIYTLSPKSREVLRQLRRDVDVVMLVPDDQTSHPIYEPTRALPPGIGRPEEKPPAGRAPGPPLQRHRRRRGVCLRQRPPGGGYRRPRR